MSKVLKAVFLGIYCAVFLHCVKYILFHTNEEILELNYLVRMTGTMRKTLRDIKKNRINSTKMTYDFQRPKRFSSDLKFILRWYNYYLVHDRTLFEGQNIFLNHNCTYYNCYITSNKGILMDIRYFDAIIFDVDMEADEQSPIRAPYQNYIFTATESAHYYPICKKEYDSYFNLTWTYKMDSDVRRPPFIIMDKRHFEIGPRLNMNWIISNESIPEDVKIKIKTKKKAIASIDFNCDITYPDELNNFTATLTDTLKENKITIDVYGQCGRRKCPRERLEECLKILKRDYYFYLAFERTFIADYISEQILYPLQNYAVPIVYGGANYTRFLPPGSYIDARLMSMEEVISKIKEAMEDSNVYSQYFSWHNHYIYKEAPKEAGICDLCELLNKPRSEYNVVKNFRKWWFPDYEDHCLRKKYIRI